MMNNGLHYLHLMCSLSFCHIQKDCCSSSGFKTGSVTSKALIIGNTEYMLQPTGGRRHIRAHYLFSLFFHCCYDNISCLWEAVANCTGGHCQLLGVSLL